MSAGSDHAPFSVDPGQGPELRSSSGLVDWEQEDSPGGGLSARVLRIALNEAMHVRLEAFHAGERVYDELVREAEARSSQILAEAQAEADRILASARSEAERTLSEAIRQAKALHDEAARQALETRAALAELRSQRSTAVRRLWSRLAGSKSEDSADTSAGLSAAASAFPPDPAPPRNRAAQSPSTTGPQPEQAAPPSAPRPFAETVASPAAGKEPPRPEPRGGEAPTGAIPPRGDGQPRESSVAGAASPRKHSWVIPDWLK